MLISFDQWLIYYFYCIFLSLMRMKYVILHEFCTNNIYFFYLIFSQYVFSSYNLPLFFYKLRNLPSKSPEEEERHRQQYQEMIEAAKRKGKRNKISVFIQY